MRDNDGEYKELDDKEWCTLALLFIVMLPISIAFWIYIIDYLL